jgi:hypothetical protein
LDEQYPITLEKYYHNILGEPVKIDFDITNAIYQYDPKLFYGKILVKNDNHNNFSSKYITEEFFRLLDFCVLCHIYKVDAIPYGNKNNTIVVIKYDGESG